LQKPPSLFTNSKKYKPYWEYLFMSFILFML
jgi:hypothetical protein